MANLREQLNHEEENKQKNDYGAAKQKLIRYGLIALIIAICGLIVFSKHQKKEQAFNECKNKAKQICEENGIKDVNIDISYSKKYEGYNIYTLHINGSFTNVDMANIYRLVKRIDAQTLDYDSTLLLSHIRLNGSTYKLDTLDENKLMCDNEVVYTYISETEKSLQAHYKDKLPYEGLLVEYINYTKLGEPDEVEYNNHLRAERRYMVYTWKDENGKTIARAQADYMDGRVYDVWINDDYKE